MKRIARWGKRNPRSAQLIIVLAHFFIAFLGIEVGLLLFARDIDLPDIAFFLPFLTFTIASLAYPIRRKEKKEWAAKFTQRKILDGILITSLAVLWLVGGNRLPQNLAYLNSVPAIADNQSATVKSMLKASENDRVYGIKKIRRTARMALAWTSAKIEKRLAQYREESPEASIFGIVLLGILLTIGLAFLALALSCNLACSGNDGAATLVMLLGIGLIVLLWILLVKWIRNVKKNAGY